MKPVSLRPWFLVLLTAGLTSTLLPQEQTVTWKGYLADQMCAFRWRGDLAESYAQRHARSCNFDEACMASGYGILVDGTFIKLTAASSPKAIAYLESITKRNNIYVEVTGTLVDDEIEVKEIGSAKKKEGKSE